MGEAICLIIDVGATASAKPADDPNAPSFLDAALECASLFVERKLFAETKDEIGVVLFGTEETRNALDYEHVRVMERGLARADWETVAFLREHVKGTNIEPDWIDALVVGLDFLKTQSTDRKFAALKIVLFSELGCRSSNDQLDIIIRGMKNLDNIDFTHIGPDWSHNDVDFGGPASNGTGGDGSQAPGPSRGEPEKPSHWHPAKPKSQIQMENEEMINQMVSETDGTVCSLDDALAIFLFKSKRGKRPWPWKVVFEIGPDIRISTTGYIQVRRENPKSWKRCLARSTEVEELKPETMLVKNNEDQDLIEPEDVVTSYQYGRSLVSITEQDEAGAKFEGGPKSMCLFGFVDRAEIQLSDLAGNGTMVFLPTEDDDQSAAALSALAQAMQELGMVAIVRKVYNRSSVPRLGVLAPEEDEDGERLLVYCDLPFAEDRRELVFRSLIDRRHMPTEAQVSAVDDLIDAMALEAEEEGGGTGWLLNPEEMMNPGYQYLFQSLTARALQGGGPGRPLPAVPRHLTACLEPPPASLAAAQPVLDRIRELFPLEEAATTAGQKAGKRTGQSVFGTQEPTAEAAAAEQENGAVTEEEQARKRLKVEDLGFEDRNITVVGSATPVEDFRYLLSHVVTTGATLRSAGTQLEGVISRLIASAFGTDLNPKIISCLQAYREECATRQQPDYYNSFIRTLQDTAGKQLWQDIIAANLGLLAEEEATGGASREEADTFARAVTAKHEAPAAKEEEEEEDMFELL